MHQREQNNWKTQIAPYEKPSMKYSVWQMINTLVPFFVLWYAAYVSLSISYWLTLLFIIPAAGFLIRTFIIFHDCCHYSYFKSRKLNVIVGTITGILTSVPYYQWRHTHAVHHATSSNLDKRGVGDVWTLTADEYLALSPLRRLHYRLYRNPLIMFGIGPIYIFLMDYRFNRWQIGLKERINTYVTNIGIVGVAGLLCLTLGWYEFLIIQGPIFLISGTAGIWLFYVQHQFEDTYFEYDEEWEYMKAAMQGSSYYKLPKALRWITGNIGFHHIHHLSSRVPNYYLELAHKHNTFLQNVPTITLLTSLKSLQFRLWNDQSKKFIGFGELKKYRNNKALRRG